MAQSLMPFSPQAMHGSMIGHFTLSILRIAKILAQGLQRYNLPAD